MRELMLELFISACVRFFPARDSGSARISWCRFRRGNQLALHTSALIGEASGIHHLKYLTTPVECHFSNRLPTCLISRTQLGSAGTLIADVGGAGQSSEPAAPLAHQIAAFQNFDQPVTDTLIMVPVGAGGIPPVSVALLTAITSFSKDTSSATTAPLFNSGHAGSKI